MVLSFIQSLIFKISSTDLWIAQVRSINDTLRLRHAQKHKHCSYGIACSTDIFKKVNIALFAYQNIAGVGSVNCTTYLGHLPKLRQCLCVRVFSIVICGKCSSGLKIVQVWSTNYESYFGHFEISGQSLNITGHFALSYIVKLISTSSHFFSHFLLLSKLYELNFFKSQNIFQTYLSIIYIWGLFTCFHLNKEGVILFIKYVFSFFLVLKLYISVCKLYI